MDARRAGQLQRGRHVPLLRCRHDALPRRDRGGRAGRGPCPTSAAAPPAIRFLIGWRSDWHLQYGVRVLEGQIYNGPYCGLLLAQLGADVIKIEPPGGEQLRFRSEQSVESHEFVMLNSNKRSVVLDLKTDAGRQALLDLVETADVLIENYAPGTMERLLLGPRLLEHNPRLIVVAPQGLRIDGPMHIHVGNGHHRAGDVGSAASTGEPGGPPTKAGASFVDFSGGIHLFGAISAALFQRERTGRGQIVEVSMHDTIYPMLASSLGGLHNDPDRELPSAPGPALGHGDRAYNIYETSDGWLAIICISERHWHGVATALGRPELIDDPRFRERADRVANIDAVDEAVSACTRTRTRRAGAGPAGRRCALRAGEVDPRGRHRRTPDPARHDPVRRAPGPGPRRCPDARCGSAIRPSDRCGPRRRWASRPTRSSPSCEPRRSTSMSFTPEPGTPLATYLGETQPGSSRALAPHAGARRVTIGAAR